MPFHNIFSKKVTLAEDVEKGHLVSVSGHKATSGTAGKEPFGVTQYTGKTGEIIAVTVIGACDVAHTGLNLGDYVKAAAGKAVLAANKAESCAVVSEKTTDKSVEILIK